MGLKWLTAGHFVGAERRLVGICLVAAAVTFSTVGSGLAQSGKEVEALRAEIQALKAGQAAMRKDLAEIKQILVRATSGRSRSEPEFKPQDITISEAPFLGQPNAAVVLVEFTDYQCPFCRRHTARTKPRLIKEYVETGMLKYVLREFPLAQIHPQAPKASEAALCAGDQGKYWEINEVLFANQRKLSIAELKTYADDLGLDMARFNECLDGAKYTERVAADLKDGANAGVRGTPSFFLGVSDPDDPGKFRATRMLRGAQPYAAFKQAIDQLIAESEKRS
jgi:protein-disulfide isomerase